MQFQSSIWTGAVLAVLAAQSAGAEPARRTFDLVTYTASDDWKVVEETARGFVSMSRLRTDSYCLVIIYAGAPASGDLDASFAAEWRSVLLRTIDEVDAPTPTQGVIGNTRAASGGTAATVKGAPAAAILMVLDAGASVVPLVAMASSMEAFEGCNEDLQGVLSSVVVKRVEAPTQPAGPAPGSGDKLVIPLPARPLTLADLAGEWKKEDRISTSYVNRDTGAHAGTDRLAFRETWTITAQGVITSDFFAIRNGQKEINKTVGSIRASASGVLDVKIGSTAQYVVRGWLEGPAFTVLKIVGPFPGGAPADVINDPTCRPEHPAYTEWCKGANLNQYWVRRAKSPPKPE